MRISLKARACAAVAMSSLFATGAAAQSAEQPKKETAEKSDSGDIIVTARRREERLQDIPMAITALTSTAIENQGISSIDDALQNATNFDLRHDENPGVYTISVRGVSQNRNGEAPVAYVVDGVTAASSIQITQELFDIERIELLKGPQGAVYGRNAIGGAINITTKTPTNDFEGQVKVQAAKHDDYRFSASVSGPIVEDKILTRISGYFNRGDGLFYNVTTKKRPDHYEDGGVRGRLIFNLSDNATFDLRGNFSKLSAGSYYYYNADSSFMNNAVGVIQGDQMGITKRRIWDVSGKFDLETPIGTLTSSTMYLNLRQFIYHQELDWTPISYLEANAGDRNKTFSQEIRLTSPGNQPFRYVFGVYYQHTKRYRFTDVYLNQTFADTGNGDPADKDMVSVAFAPQNQKQVTKSIFGQINYDILPELELTLAGRYDHDDRDDTQPSFGKRTRKDSKFQPKASLTYKITPDALVYATYAVGYRPGGFNAPNPIQSEIRSETLRTYEAGFKTSWLDHKLRFNGSAYYNDFSNQQFFLLANSNQGVVQLIVNNQKSKIQGFELELSGNPTPDLQLNASYGMVDPKMKRFDLPTIIGGTTQFEGNYLPNTAKYTMLLGAQYTPKISDTKSLLLRADFRRYGRTYWAFDNADSQKPYNIVDLRAGVKGENWSVTAFAENVFNKKYVVESFIKEFTGFVTDIAWPSKPAFYGVEASFKF